VARARSSSVAFGARTRRRPMEKVPSLSQNGVFSPFGAVYLPGRHKKKKARQIMFMMDTASTVTCCLARLGDWDWLEEFGRVVRFRIAFKLSSQSKFCFARAGQSRVRGPQSCKGLTHGT
jgi:hypothetical protein